MLAVCQNLETEIFHADARLFLERQTFDLKIQRVFGERLQGYVCAELPDVQMSRVEDSRCFGHKPLVEAHFSSSDEDGIDAQVDVFLARRVLRSKGIDQELHVGLSFRVVLVDIDVTAKQLRVVDDDLSFQDGGDVQLGRKTGSPQQSVLLLVHNQHIIYNNTVQ